MTGKNCLVLGDINIDFNIHAKAYPPEGGEAHSEQADFRLGGSGCLTAVACTDSDALPPWPVVWAMTPLLILLYSTSEQQVWILR